MKLSECCYCHERDGIGKVPVKEGWAHPGCKLKKLEDDRRDKCQKT